MYKWMLCNNYRYWPAPQRWTDGGRSPSNKSPQAASAQGTRSPDLPSRPPARLYSASFGGTGSSFVHSFIAARSSTPSAFDRKYLEDAASAPKDRTSWEGDGKQTPPVKIQSWSWQRSRQNGLKASEAHLGLGSVLALGPGVFTPGRKSLEIFLHGGDIPLPPFIIRIKLQVSGDGRYSKFTEKLDVSLECHHFVSWPTI